MTTGTSIARPSLRRHPCGDGEPTPLGLCIDFDIYPMPFFARIETGTDSARRPFVASQTCDGWTAAVPSAELTRQIARALLELTTRLLGKKPEVTSIAVEYVSPQHWIVGGRSLAEQGKSSFYFDIKITDETNTKTEKAEYIRQAFDAFSRLLGDVHEESYIYVQDVRATAYGYGGKTQEFRFQNPRS